MENLEQSGLAAPPRQGLATGSLIIGFLSFFSLAGLGVGAVVGIVLGVVALRKISSFPKEHGGKSKAITGIVLCVLSILGTGLLLIDSPGLISGRRQANEATAIQTLRNLHAAQLTYQSGKGKGNFGSADDLFMADLIDEELAGALGVRRVTLGGGGIREEDNPPKSGYLFRMTANQGAGSSPPRFSVVASVADRGNLTRTGTRNFFVDESGVIRFSESVDQIPTAASPSVP